MSDIDDRLAALDPAASQPYQHPNLDEFITRAMRPPRPRRRRLPGRFKAKMAGAVLTSAVLAAGAISLLQSGVNPPLLTIQSTAASGGALHRTLGAYGPASGATAVHFSAGKNLSVAPSSANAYELANFVHGAREASRLARAFGLTTAPALVHAHDWQVIGPAGQTLTYDDALGARWSFASSRKAPSWSPAPFENVPARTVLEGDVRRYLAKMGLTYATSSPRFAQWTTSVSSNPASSITSSETITVMVVVRGQVTSLTMRLRVSKTNVVLDASGPVFAVHLERRYPLVSPSVAFRALTTPTHSNSAYASTAPPLPGTANVTLRSVSLILEPYQLTNKSRWLLPTYAFVQVSKGASGETTQQTWNELAINPHFVLVSG